MAAEKVLKDERVGVYEIGYLLVPSLPEEKVESVTTSLREHLTKKGATLIAEEAPELRTLAYTMTKKIGASNHKFDEAYFGWFKFDLPVKEIAGIKVSFEENPQMLRVLVISTVREATYLGKKSATAVIKIEEPALIAPEAKDVPEASAEEMDKTIDAIVKEA